jgi:ribosomal protein S18 acetylase RimI-like enzyme
MHLPASIFCDLTYQIDGYPRYLPQDLGAFLADSSQLAAWVAEASDEVIVGHIALHAGPGDPSVRVAAPAAGLAPHQLAVVARLAVHPSVRRRGVASELLAAATGHAHSNRLTPVLDVLQESQPALSCTRVSGGDEPVRSRSPLPG